MKLMKKQSERGQSLVEFAISLPVLILLLSGLVDFGRAYYTFIALEEAAAEAALYYAIFPSCPDASASVTGIDCSDPNNAIYRATNSGNGEFDSALATWNIPYDAVTSPAQGWRDPLLNGCSTIGCSVLVQVRYPFEILTPGIRFFLGGGDTLPIRTQASQIIVYDTD
ncbi:MAG: TadE family protein [Phototrophicaceae bacterium]